MLILMTHGAMVWSQARESGGERRAQLAVGAGLSGSYLQYGESKLGGVAAWVDYDTPIRLGIEAEGNWLRFHQQADVHVNTWMGGLRYHFNAGRFQPYIKGMSGVGEFTFPYNYAHGSYLVVAPGGGVDYQLNQRWSLRVDGEYQFWPEFTFGAMRSGSVVIGIRRRLF